jgi:hypothetical protein
MTLADVLLNEAVNDVSEATVTDTLHSEAPVTLCLIVSVPVHPVKSVVAVNTQTGLAVPS